MEFYREDHDTGKPTHYVVYGNTNKVHDDHVSVVVSIYGVSIAIELSWTHIDTGVDKILTIQSQITELIQWANKQFQRIEANEIMLPFENDPLFVVELHEKYGRGLDDYTISKTRALAK